MPYTLDQVPSKLFYSISEVSEFTGVEPHVLRYWETKFTKLSPKRVGGNQRKYTRKDLELLFTIIHLLYTEGFTLDGAEKKLKERIHQKLAASPSPTPVAPSPGPEVLGARVGDQRAQPEVFKELKNIKSELSSILELLKK